MKKLILTSLFLIFLSCNSNENLERNTIEKLFVELKKQKDFESDLTLNTLIEFFKNVNISKLTSGKKIEQEYLFENIECDCRDRISIQYSSEKNQYELIIYEEYFIKDLDWCPETSYFFSFKLNNNQVENVKLEQIAG
jgi:hypothetical protein